MEEAQSRRSGSRRRSHRRRRRGSETNSAAIVPPAAIAADTTSHPYTMIRLLLLSVLSALLPSCASNGGLSVAYGGNIGPVPYRFSYAGGKATVSIRAPWRNLIPDESK